MPKVEKIVLKVTKDFNEIRLDKFLVKNLPKFSRSYLQKLIKTGNVSVNKKVAKASLKVRDSDKIIIIIPPAKKIELKPEKIKLDIIYEDEDILVINKPAGLLVHPTKHQQKRTLVNAILANCPNLKRIGDKIRPGIIHRLDKDTSGLILVAKNDKTHRYLTEQFQKREVEKKYIALLCGRLKTKQGLIKSHIGRALKNRKKMAVLTGGKGKLAETYYKVIKYYDNFTLVEVAPKTGRTHQIRVHMLSLNYPVAGDKIYKFKNQQYLFKINRQFLHAYFLKFRLLSGRLKEFKIGLPKDLKDILRQFKDKK